MKKIYFACCLLVFFSATQAQKPEPVNTKTDRREFQGYTIRLVPAQGRTYGYEVTQGTSRVIYQLQNPFTTSSKGLSKKEDAFAVAQYQIRQLKKRQGAYNGRNLAAANAKKRSTTVAQKVEVPASDETLYNQRLSPKVAEQLKISITQ